MTQVATAQAQTISQEREVRTATDSHSMSADWWRLDTIFQSVPTGTPTESKRDLDTIPGYF